MSGSRREFDDSATVGVFGTVLRLHRQRLALSQEDLADATRGGVAARTISDLERGVARCPRSETVRLLAEALGLSGDELAAFRAAARAARYPDMTGRAGLARRADMAGLASRPVPDGPSAGRRTATGPLIIVTDATHLAEVESLLSAARDCLIVVTGGHRPDEPDAA
jgi:transcriptional regulator with XRE-family HTH domain